MRSGPGFCVAQEGVWSPCEPADDTPVEWEGLK